MNTFTVAALLHHFLFSLLVQSAPVSLPSNSLTAFREAAERAKTLVEKILKDIPAVHSTVVHTEGLTLEPSSQTANLQMMVKSLGIPAAPVLKPLSQRFTLDICVSRMLAGSQMYQGLLGVLSVQMSELSDLQADLRDLQMHIRKMKEVAHLSSSGEETQSFSQDLASRGNFDIQVAAHLSLTQLRYFCHDLIRSLRAIASSRPQVAGSH